MATITAGFRRFARFAFWFGRNSLPRDPSFGYLKHLPDRFYARSYNCADRFVPLPEQHRSVQLRASSAFWAPSGEQELLI
jgi:hypothetical protein